MAVRIRIGRPVIFRQSRSGRRNEAFTLYKFRTMTIETNSKGEPLTDRERITPLGSKLRRSSIDELPELWNVLIGDMSLVGPRPLLPEYLSLYSAEQARRHAVRPGITGLAQVLGRNDTTWERRLELDVWYVDHRSVWLDLKILVKTVVNVLSQSGVHADGEITMAPFDGTASVS